MQNIWKEMLTSWFRTRSSRTRTSARRSRRCSYFDQNRRGALISQLEPLESRRLLTSLLAVEVRQDSISLRDLGGLRSSSGDSFDIAYTATQFVLTGRNGTEFRVGGQDLSTYTVPLTSPASVTMFLGSQANEITLTGDGTAKMGNLTVFAGRGKGGSDLTLTNVKLDSMTFHGGRGNDRVTLEQSTVDRNLRADLGRQEGDRLDLEDSTIGGDLSNSSHDLIMNKSTITGSLKAVQHGSESTFSSTSSTYSGDALIRMGRDGVINLNGSATGGPNHFHGRQQIFGLRRHQTTLNQTPNAVVNDVTPKLRNVNVNNQSSTVANPTVVSLAGVKNTPVVTGTFDPTAGTALSVAANGKTYVLGTDTNLTSPSAGNWKLDLKDAPLPAGSTTFTATNTNSDGTSASATGTVATDAQVNTDLPIIRKYLTTNNLTAKETNSGLNYVTTTLGTGAIPTSGQTITAFYTGYLLNADGTQGTRFDSNTTSPGFSFKLGAGQVIKGWDEAFALLPVGTVAKLLIPSSSAYGAAGSPPNIPANTPLIFDVTVVSASTANPVATPTVASLTGVKNTPIVTGTFDSKSGTALSVAANGKTYVLGTDTNLTSPSAGNWQLDLKDAPLPAGSTTITATNTNSAGTSASGTGTVATDAQVNAELPNIRKYLTTNSLTAKETNSGLNYVITTPATGAIPTSGQTVTANYTGYVLNADGTQGAQFDSNTAGTFSFKLGVGQVIKGWDEAFALLPVGTVAKLLIPSPSAYGVTGSGLKIPPNTTLIFDVTAVSAK